MRKGFAGVIVLAVAAFAVLVSSSAVPAQMKTDPAISKLAAEWEKAYNAGDFAKVGSLYAEDGILMPPNEPAVRGRTNIEARFKKFRDEGMTQVKLVPTESVVSGNLAFEAGTATVTIQPPSGAAMTDVSKYVVVLKQVGGQWKLAYDIFNSDNPPPPPTK